MKYNNEDRKKIIRDVQKRRSRHPDWSWDKIHKALKESRLPHYDVRGYDQRTKEKFEKIPCLNTLRDWVHHAEKTGSFTGRYRGRPPISDELEILIKSYPLCRTTSSDMRSTRSIQKRLKDKFGISLSLTCINDTLSRKSSLWELETFEDLLIEIYPGLRGGPFHIIPLTDVLNDRTIFDNSEFVAVGKLGRASKWWKEHKRNPRQYIRSEFADYIVGYYEKRE